MPEDREPREAWMREWRTPAGVAVGRNDDGTVDEILWDANPALPYAQFHIEQMDTTYYWARFGDLHVHFSYRPGRRCTLTLGWIDSDR